MFYPQCVLKDRLFWETFVTLAALIWFFSSVCPDVLFKITNQRESLVNVMQFISVKALQHCLQWNGFSPVCIPQMFRLQKSYHIDSPLCVRTVLFCEKRFKRTNLTDTNWFGLSVCNVRMYNYDPFSSAYIRCFTCVRSGCWPRFRMYIPVYESFFTLFHTHRWSSLHLPRFLSSVR